MKAKAVILTNWALSLCVLGSMDAEATPLRAVIPVFVWFGVSSVLLMRADRKGVKKDLKPESHV
jgi:hypothetical protein